MRSKSRRSTGKTHSPRRPNPIRAPAGPPAARAGEVTNGFFNHEIEAIRRQHDRLRQRAAAAGDENELLAAALNELSKTLTGLQASVAELRQQSDELAAANQALAVERQRYVELFEEAPDPYLATDSAGVIIEANHAATMFLDRARNSLVRKPLSVFVAPDERRAFLARLSQLRTGDETGQRWELRIQPHNGRTFHAAVSVTTVRDGGGNLVRVRWLLRNITDRKSAEALATSTRREVENIMESIPDVLYVLDTETRLVRWNTQLEIVTGLARPTLARMRAPDLVVDDDRAALDRSIGQALATGYSQTEARLRSADGSPVPFQCITVPLKNSTGAIVGLTGIARDISERKQAEAALTGLSSQLLRLQDEERRRIARELHDSTAQNLAGLAMNLSLVAKGAKRLDAPARKALAESAALTEQSLEEIRTISYLLHPPLLDEIGLVSAVRWYATGFAERSGVHVDVDVAPSVGRMVPAVEMTLFRIVQESLTNVHRHSRGTAVNIRVALQPTAVTLEIADNGVGMTPSQASDGHGGNRLGVGIMGMRERVHQLGGTLDIRFGDSGTTVHATIPLRADGDPAQ